MRARSGDKDYWPIKEAEVLEAIHNAGFKSIAAFARECGIEPCNVAGSIRGKTHTGIERLFTYANVLGLPIGDVVEMFYPIETEDNKQAVWERVRKAGKKK